jgi:hypothetical protein
MKIEFKNKVLRLDSQSITNNEYKFEKGYISGYSIEVFEPETESYTSYIYYNDEKNRDIDYEMLSNIR